MMKTNMGTKPERIDMLCSIPDQLQISNSRTSSRTLSAAISGLFPSETTLTPNITATASSAFSPTSLTSIDSNLSLTTIGTVSSPVCKDLRSFGSPTTEKVVFNNIVDIEALYLANHGYTRGKQIASALQGFVYEIHSVKDGNTYIVKQAEKRLHSKGIIIKNRKKYAVKENIKTETAILQFITKYSTWPYSIKFVDFFKSETFYYLVMTNGGSSLFDFVIKAHKYIREGRISIKEWRKCVKYTFWQMAVMLLWLHNQANLCHLDVSLENILVQNNTFIDKGNGKLCIPTNIQIQFCDFGVAEFYDIELDGSNLNNGYMSTKYCGKPSYNSPQVYKNEMFDGRKADVWSLGVVLFCVSVGSPPYKRPNKEDEVYINYIQRGRFAQLLYMWKKHFYVTEHMLFLMKEMLKQNESERLLMDDIIQHKWLRKYYSKYYDLVKRDFLTTIYKCDNND